MSNEVKNNDKKQNMVNNQFRAGFYRVPENYVYRQEDFFGREPGVIPPGGLQPMFGYGRAFKIDDIKEIDFTKQKIDGKDRQDIFVDITLRYRIAGDVRPNSDVIIKGASKEEKKIIKSKNKETRREWSKTHPVHLYVMNEKAIKEEEKHNGVNSDNQKGPMQSAIMSVIRKHLTNKTFEEVQVLDSATTGSLYEEIKADVEKELNTMGIQLASIMFTSVEQKKEKNELDEKKVMAEKQAEIDKINANARKKVAEIDAAAEAFAIKKKGEAEADAIKAKGEAEADALEKQMKAAEGADGQKIAALKTKEANFNAQSYNFVGAGEAIATAVSAFKNPTTAPSAADIVSDIKDSVAKKTETAPVKTETDFRELKDEESEVVTVVDPEPLTEPVKEEVVSGEVVVTEEPKEAKPVSHTVSRLSDPEYLAALRSLKRSDETASERTIEEEDDDFVPGFDLDPESVKAYEQNSKLNELRGMRDELIASQIQNELNSNGQVKSLGGNSEE